MIRLSIAFLLIICFINCSENRTEIVVNIYSEYSVPEEIDRIELRIQRAETELFSKEYKLESNSELPVKILITQENNSEELIGIRVRGKKGNNILTETYVEKAFIKNKRLDVDIYLKKVNVSDAGYDILELNDADETDVEVLSDAGYETDISTGSEDLGDVISADDVSELIYDTGCSLYCGSNAKCVNGECKCNSGFENCDGKWDNGCEGDILNDPKYCGGCNSDCAPLNVEKALCINGECGYSSCNLMYEDYDKEKKNGCEKFNYFPKVYGGLKDDFLEDMLVTKDGGILLLATTKSCCFGTNDLWVAKLDKNGNIVWQRVIGKDREIKGPLDMTELEDGSVMIIGSTNSFGVKEMAGLVIRVDKNGNILNSKILDNGEWITFKKIDCDRNINCKIVGSASVVGNTGPDLLEFSLDNELKIKSQRLFRFLDKQGDEIEFVEDAFIVSNEDVSGNGSLIIVVLNADRTINYIKKLSSIHKLRFHSCAQLQSDGFYCSVVLANPTNYDILLFRFLYGNKGSIAFKKAFGDKENDLGFLSDSSNIFSLNIAGISYKNNIGRAFTISMDINGNVKYSKYFNSEVGEGIFKGLLYNNKMILLGGVSLSYGEGGIDVLISPLGVNGEFISECHFENEGSISFDFYEPELFLEDVNLEGILDTDFRMTEVTFDIEKNPDFGVKSICGK